MYKHPEVGMSTVDARDCGRRKSKLGKALSFEDLVTQVFMASLGLWVRRSLEDRRSRETRQGCHGRCCSQCRSGLILSLGLRLGADMGSLNLGMLVGQAWLVTLQISYPDDDRYRQASAVSAHSRKIVLEVEPQSGFLCFSRVPFSAYKYHLHSSLKITASGLGI